MNIMALLLYSIFVALSCGWVVRKSNVLNRLLIFLPNKRAFLLMAETQTK